MNFMFELQKRYLTRSLRSLARYCSCHENIKIHIFEPTCNVLFIIWRNHYNKDYCYGRALHAVIEVELSCLTVVWQMTCQRSHICWCASWCTLTPCCCFASPFCFGSFKNIMSSGFARDRCRFPSRRLPYTSICLSSFCS